MGNKKGLGKKGWAGEREKIGTKNLGKIFLLNLLNDTKIMF